MNSITERLRGAATIAGLISDRGAAISIASTAEGLRQVLLGLAEEVQALESRRPDPPLHEVEPISLVDVRLRVAGGWVYRTAIPGAGITSCYVPDPRLP